MGLTHVDAVVSGLDGGRAAVRLLVDSGATYTLLPLEVWRAIGLAPRRRMEFTLADGTIAAREVSECLIQLPQGEAHTPVILGQPGDEGLLGVVTLKELGWS